MSLHGSGYNNPPAARFSWGDLSLDYYAGLLGSESSTCSVLGRIAIFRLTEKGIRTYTNAAQAPEKLRCNLNMRNNTIY